jgi:hypothetical protein
MISRVPARAELGFIAGMLVLSSYPLQARATMIKRTDAPMFGPVS